MGLSSSKSKSSTKPIYAPQIEGAASTVSNAYNQQAPYIDKATQAINTLIPSLTDAAQKGIGVNNAASGYNTDVLNGKYLDAGNPYLQDIINQSNNDTRNQLEASLGSRGLTGTSNYADIISKNLANNEANLRYTNYANERNAMATAAGQAAGNAATSLGSLTGAAQAQTLPISAASGYGSTIGGLLGSYTNQTQKSSASPFSNILGGLGLGLQGYSILSDARAKTDIRRVGMTDGGLPIYTYRYKGDDRGQMGVLAQDVAAMQPHALGPTVAGLMTVDLAEVR